MRGGLGDVKVKKFLIKVLEEELAPIRERRKQYEADIPGVYEILKKGTLAAREIGKKTMAEVKAAMRINYFEDEELIKSQVEKFKNKD
nr:tryptophan--tRNA ligase [Lachnospiraceae bacterium]